MTRFIDARIPVAFGGKLGPRDHLVHANADWAVLHPPGCTCCITRDPAALALDRLFLDRVRGAIPWFDRVVVQGDGDPVRRALAEDAVARSRYRLA